MLAVLGVAVLSGSVWIEHRTEITLPTPTGPIAVGRAVYDWADDATSGKQVLEPEANRELLVWIWYPATAGQSPLIEDCLPAPQLGPQSNAIAAHR
jgi:hypothetical protein